MYLLIVAFSFKWAYVDDIKNIKRQSLISTHFRLTSACFIFKKNPKQLSFEQTYFNPLSANFTKWSNTLK